MNFKVGDRVKFKTNCLPFKTVNDFTVVSVYNFPFKGEVVVRGATTTIGTFDNQLELNVNQTLSKK